MKILTKVVIDMETMDVVEECAHEYDGPVAECKGGGSTTTYAQSPAQEKLYSAMLPAVNRIASAGATGGTLYNPVPMSNYYPGNTGGKGSGSNANPYDTSGLMPTGNWFGELDPSIKSGLWKPWEEAGNQAVERLGAMGQLGSFRGGASGAAGAALGQVASDAATQMPLQAWQMTMPGRQAAFQEPLKDMRAQWGAAVSAQRMPYEIVPGMAGGSLPQPVVTSGGK